MLYRRLGRSGLKVSALGFGAGDAFGTAVGRGEARRLVSQAYDAGINLFDGGEGRADGEAERIIGDVLADLRLPRETLVVSCRMFPNPAQPSAPIQDGLSRKRLREACDAALKRLRVDYLDLFVAHPLDAWTPVEETVWAMDQLVRAGKVLYWGSCEWPAAAIAEADRIAKVHHLVGPSMERPRYDLMHRERVEHEYAPLYESVGLGLITWTAAYTATGVPHFTALAAELGIEAAALAMAWGLGHPRVSSVILDMTGPETLAQGLLAIETLARQGLDTQMRRIIIDSATPAPRSPPCPSSMCPSFPPARPA